MSPSRPTNPGHDRTLADCTGVILAGGYSTRFGRDKANVQWQGRSLLAHVAATLRAVCPQVLAVARHEQPHQGWPVDRVIFDDPAWPDGPLRGVVAGLQAGPTPYAFVVSCDTPCLRPALLAALRRSLMPGSLAVIPQWQGHPQPLVALYAVSAGNLLQDLLLQGERSPRHALASLPHVPLAEDDCRQADPLGLSFWNLNSQADLNALDHLLRSRPDVATP
jgi:molybdopterin-guanine dinucleotide biosynthesis protein A